MVINDCRWSLHDNFCEVCGLVDVYKTTENPAEEPSDASHTIHALVPHAARDNCVNHHPSTLI